MNRRFGHALILLLSGLLVSCNESSVQPDGTAPNAVRDLSVQEHDGVYTLEWTAPGDDLFAGQAAQYDIRYSASSIVDHWDGATAIPFPPRIPSPAGEEDSLVVPTLPSGTWQIALKAADEVPNWSAISNVVTIDTAPDTIPPAPVMDLAAEVSWASVRLTWTATGDDGQEGRAASYDLRYTEGAITELTWPTATRVVDVAKPGPSGQIEEYTVSDLEPGTEYGFALVVVDGAGNSSGLSNTVMASIASYPPVRVTTGTATASSPDWSLNGDRIVFTGPESQLYVVAATGGSAVKATSIAGAASRADWSPDGTKVAFAQASPVEAPSVLAVMSPVPNGRVTELANHGAQKVLGPRWSPDGMSIAYMALESKPPPSPLVGSIFVVSATGGDPELILGGLEFAGLDWSPDGASFVYSARVGGVFELWTLPTDGGTPTRLTETGGNKVSPAWSPDGEAIAYLGDGGTVWILSLSTQEAKLVETPGYSSSVGWAPDSDSIIYSVADSAGGGIWVQRVR